MSGMSHLSISVRCLPLEADGPGCRIHPSVHPLPPPGPARHRNLLCTAQPLSPIHLVHVHLLSGPAPPSLMYSTQHLSPIRFLPPIRYLARRLRPHAQHLRHCAAPGPAPRRHCAHSGCRRLPGPRGSARAPDRQGRGLGAAGDARVSGAAGPGASSRMMAAMRLLRAPPAVLTAGRAARGRAAPRPPRVAGGGLLILCRAALRALV